MTPEEIRRRVRKLRLATEPEDRLLNDFWFFTGLKRAFLTDLDDDDLMQLWARFRLERIEEVTK